jgi:HlyD family type I secretion membrane fusion protein
MFKDPFINNLRSVKSDDFLPNISPWTTLGGLFLAGTIGAAIALAFIIKYDITIRAIATVRPSGEIRTVQAGQEGTVKSIKVKVNQFVKKGDEIATLEDSLQQTKKSQLIGNIQQNQLQLKLIASELKALQAQITAESKSTEQEIKSATADLSRNQRDYQDRQVTGTSEIQAAEASLAFAKAEMERYQQLKETGAISQLQIQEKEQAYKIALARFHKAQTGLNPNSDNIAIAQKKIYQQKAKGESTRATLNRELEGIINRQVEIENKISSNQKEAQQISQDLQKTTIRATESGTILKLELRNLGQILHNGDVIAQIVPTSSPLVVKAHVAPQDISKVKVCQAQRVSNCQEGQVQMRFSAYPYPDYGVMSGAVRAISADVIVPEKSSEQPYYDVTIQPERLYLKKGGQTYPLQPGLEISADIVAKEETVLTFFLRKVRLITDL